MGINVFPTPSSAAVTPTGWTAGVAGTFTLSSTLPVGTYLVETDATQTMTITLQDSGGRKYAGTIRGGSGFITVATAVNQIIIPGSLTYPFGIQINPISVTQLAAPTSLSLSISAGGTATGTWDTAPTGSTGAVLFTPTGSVLNFSSTTSGATVALTANTDVVMNTTNQFVVAFKNSSGAIGLGSTFSVAIPASFSIVAEYLAVGAGGFAGGGAYSGGGGAGGGAVKTGSNLTMPIGSTLSITIAGQTTTNANGASTILGAITAIGGGRGNYGAPDSGNAGVAGASGSGARVGSSVTATFNGGAGNDGFAGATVSNNGSSFGAIIGGGGGAGGAGSNKNAGPGAASTITGATVYYGGGGNGSDYGGNGTTGNGATARATNGAANTGAGAGAGDSNTYTGGSGVVVIAYPTTSPALTTIPGGLTYTVDTTTRAGYRVYRFTSGTGTVTI
jgi:hypothetical protein